jgi:glycosyltransferase involved in cell wall biosynthesis
LKEELGLGGRVILAEGLRDECLLWCYEHCEALLMPSHTEGFGLPAAEALLAGCKIVCSDIPALREVGGSHCDYVRLESDAVDAFADAVLASIAKPAPAPVPQPQFSAECIAREYSLFYSSVLATSGGASVPVNHALDANCPASERSVS